MCASRWPSGCEYRVSQNSPSSDRSQRARRRGGLNTTPSIGAAVTSQVTDVLETVQSFVAKGYNREYRVKDGNLVDLDLGSTLDPCALRIDAALRLESGSDAEDASNIYAITDPATGHKGLLIDAFDVFDLKPPNDEGRSHAKHLNVA